VRIAIVNDVPRAADLLRQIIISVPGCQVAWDARGGAEAVERCRQDTPDLVLMDLMMPVTDGAEVTRRIMAHTPCAILLVTPTFDAHCGKVFEALGAGALDAVQMPILEGSGQLGGAAELRFKIEMIGRLVSVDKGANLLGRPAQKSRPTSVGTNRLVAIGASAGGPAALATILTGLPRDFSAATVIIQHVDEQFVPLMASWLNERSSIPVRIARQGDRPEVGTALMACTRDHLVLVDAQSLDYTAEPSDCQYRPSVDVFFQSVARYWRGDVAGVLLTGMGRDGAKGLKALRDAGAFTIAQDSASCVVYGMPKAAADLDAAMDILPVEKIAMRLINFLSRTSLMSK
jgi:two-component system response regulator WspF